MSQDRRGDGVQVVGGSNPPCPTNTFLTPPPATMRHRIINAPGEGDCFYHVVSHFRGNDINDEAAAALIRHQLSLYAASVLFAAPYNSLDTLTNYILGGGDPGAVVLQNTADAAAIAHNFTQRPGGGNGGNCPLPAFIVWHQYSYQLQLQKKRQYFDAHPLKNVDFLRYVIWGDDFVADLVTRRYQLQCRFYTPMSVGAVNVIEQNVVNFYMTQDPDHFDAVEFENGDPLPPPVKKKKKEGDTGGDDLPAEGNLRLEIHHIDVGQGDSTLVLLRNGDGVVYSCLIDGGESGQALMIHDYMAACGVIALNHIFVTHYDRDHFRGVLALLAKSKICQSAIVFDRGDDEDAKRKMDNVLSGKMPNGDPRGELLDDRQFVDEVEELQAYLQYENSVPLRATAGKSATFLVGQTLVSVGDIFEIVCLSANGFVVGGTYVDPLHKDRENGRSLNLVLRFFDFHYYFGGDSPGLEGHDLEGAVAKVMMANVDHVCGFKASHHKA